MLDLATKTTRNVTGHQAGDFRPARSPDGQWIAFSSDRDPMRAACPNTTAPGPGPFVTPQYTGIYIIHPDGSALRRLTTPKEVGGTPHWPLDGSRVAFWAGDPEQVCRGGLILGTGTTQIISVNVLSGARDTVTSGAGVKIFPRWLDTSRIVYQTREELRFSGTDSLLAGEFQAADWSPDRRTMVFHRETDSRGDRDRDFQSWPSLDSQFALLRVPDASSFSPAGDRMVYMLTNFAGIAFATTRQGFKDEAVGLLLVGTFQPAGEVAVMRPDGSDLRLLVDKSTEEGAPSWIPGRRP